jgi:mono/diheme cytochrome c family protein
VTPPPQGVVALLFLVASCVPSFETKNVLDFDPSAEHPTEDPLPPPLDAGATSATGDAAAGEIPTWWGDVEPIVRAQCHLCHGPVPQYGAPMPLAAYADVLAPARSDPTVPVHARIAARVARNNGLPPMPPVANGALTDAEIELIRVWSENGAPEGIAPAEKPDAGLEPDAGEPELPPDAGSGDPNEEPYLFIPIVAPQAAVRPGEQDLYGCFRTVIQTQVPLHAIEIEPTLDQSAVVHHILLFRDGGRNYPEQRTGLFCAADTVLQSDWELLHGWAPGGETMVLPPEAGVRLEDGDHLVVQIHYNNFGAQTVVDSSGMMLKATASLRANDAAVLGVGTQNFTLPPGQPSVSESGTCELTRPMHIFSYSPHMHLLGRGAKLELIRNGQTTVLGDVQNFAFESQISYPADVELAPGDSVKTTCTWDTTSRTTETSFGEGTEDEMCYIFVAHYPPFGQYSCGD